MKNTSYFNNLKQVDLEINERATIKPAIKKLAELRGGKQAILEQYTDIYTDEELYVTLKDYHQQKMSEITSELSAYDEYSQSLVAKANMYINELENRMKKLVDPNTEYELQKHNYLFNKLKITVFTSANPSMDELDSILKQPEYEKGYAKASIHLQSKLKCNINNNNQISNALKQSLHINLTDKMQEVHMRILQIDYQTIQKIKKNINNNIGLATGQLHQFVLLYDVD